MKRRFDGTHCLFTLPSKPELFAGTRHVEKLKPLLIEAKKGAYGDRVRVSPGATTRRTGSSRSCRKRRTKPKVDIVKAFELYCSQPRIKGEIGGDLRFRD